jgi:hypothetical protein
MSDTHTAPNPLRVVSGIFGLNLSMRDEPPKHIQLYQRGHHDLPQHLGITARTVRSQSVRPKVHRVATSHRNKDLHIIINDGITGRTPVIRAGEIAQYFMNPATLAARSLARERTPWPRVSWTPRRRVIRGGAGPDDAGMARWTPLAEASLVAREKPHRRSGRPEVGGDGCYLAHARYLFGGYGLGPSPSRRPRWQRYKGVRKMPRPRVSGWRRNQEARADSTESVQGCEAGRWCGSQAGDGMLGC